MGPVDGHRDRLFARLRRPATGDSGADSIDLHYFIRVCNVDMDVAALERIEHYVTGLSFEEFRRDPKTIDAVIRNLTVIGEASSRLTAATKHASPGIPGADIIEAYEQQVRGSFEVDEVQLWKTITEDLKPLHKPVSVVSH